MNRNILSAGLPSYRESLFSLNSQEINYSSRIPAYLQRKSSEPNFSNTKYPPNISIDQIISQQKSSLSSCKYCTEKLCCIPNTPVIEEPAQYDQSKELIRDDKQKQMQQKKYLMTELNLGDIKPNVRRLIGSQLEHYKLYKDNIQQILQEKQKIELKVQRHVRKYAQINFTKSHEVSKLHHQRREESPEVPIYESIKNYQQYDPYIPPNSSTHLRNTLPESNSYIDPTQYKTQCQLRHDVDEEQQCISPFFKWQGSNKTPNQEAIAPQRSRKQTSIRLIDRQNQNMSESNLSQSSARLPTSLKQTKSKRKLGITVLSSSEEQLSIQSNNPISKNLIPSIQSVLQHPANQHSKKTLSSTEIFSKVNVKTAIDSSVDIDEKLKSIEKKMFDEYLDSHISQLRDFVGVTNKQCEENIKSMNSIICKYEAQDHKGKEKNGDSDDKSGRVDEKSGSSQNKKGSNTLFSSLIDRIKI